MKTITVSNSQELELIFPVIRELRPHLDYAEFRKRLEGAQKGGYRLIGVPSENGFQAAMGYRIIEDFVHGRHLYVDDLIVTEEARSTGLGAQLLQLAEQLAREEKCEGLRLCTGIENERGKKFYEREGWTLRAVAYKKKA